jgi:hypothetical protein
VPRLGGLFGLFRMIRLPSQESKEQVQKERPEKTHGKPMGKPLEALGCWYLGSLQQT